MLKNATLIAGPTASGKSQLAVALARARGGIVVNADSMQVYSVLSVLTARPDARQLAAAPHRLYGHVSPDRRYSTGHWLADVRALIDEGAFDERPAIFVGGTGLYFRALTQGLSPMPNVPEAIRAEWRARLAEEGAPALHRLLGERDPAAARAIGPGDGQRIARALEVLSASGRPISQWQAEKTRPLVDGAASRLVVLEPERPALAARIAARFECMVDAGAAEEVRALLALGLDPAMPAMKAIGVRELGAFLRGELDREAAIERAATATRRYAKRQATWFRHQLDAQWRRLPVTAQDDADGLLERLGAR